MLRLRYAMLAVGSLVGSASLGACHMESGDGTESQGALASAGPSNVFVLTSRNDKERTGLNPKETILNVNNVKGAGFGRVATRNLDGNVYAQPLYVGGVNGKNVVYVATEHNTVYAFDADDTRPDAQPLWKKNVGPSVPVADYQCGLLAPEAGITSTPVIDLEAKTMWFTSRTKVNGQLFHNLHAVDIATGADRPGSPTVVTAKAPGNGSTSVGGVISLDPLRNHQRPGLLKVGNKIYLGFASLCDIRPYHGWVLAYDATTLQQTAVHLNTPNGGEGGIWHGGSGLMADDAGDVYYAGGDAYDTSGQTPWNGADSYANSLVRLRDKGNTLSVETSFTPFDTTTWSPRDLSIGNMGGILIPGTNLLVAGDKRGVQFLVDRNSMGGGGVDQDGQVVQKFRGTAKGMWGPAAYYKKGTGGSYYVWGTGDVLKSYHFNGTKFDAVAQNPALTIGYPNAALSLSSNGETDGTAILWALRTKRTSTGLSATGGPSALDAYDANDISKRLWTSDDNTDDAIGNASKFASPTIAGGKVFVGTSSSQLVIYGVKNGTPPNPPTTTDGGTPVVDANVPPVGDAPTWTEVYTKYLGPNTPGHCSNNGGCHTSEVRGFKCGTSKEECYQGLVAATLIKPGDPAHSPFGIPDVSPLAWLGGVMPLDNAVPNPEAGAAVKAWVEAGAQNN
jgi:hypothetical protein